MMNFEKGMKLRSEVTFIDEVVYYVQPTHYYDDGCRKIYKFIDDEGNLFVWKTSKALGMDYITDNGDEGFEFVDIGDKIFLKATVKGNCTYKYEDQVILTRCEVMCIIQKNHMSEEEIKEFQKNLQMSKLDKDSSIRTITYKEYKSEYQQYETVVGSFQRTDRGCFIDVIIPNKSSIYYYTE